MSEVEIKNEQYSIAHIVGTNWTIVEVWEPTGPSARLTSCGYRHQTIRNFEINGERVMHGRIGTRELPREITNLPSWTDEFKLAAEQFWPCQYAAAYTLLTEKFGKLLDDWHNMVKSHKYHSGALHVYAINNDVGVALAGVLQNFLK